MASIILVLQRQVQLLNINASGIHTVGGFFYPNIKVI